MSEVVKPAASLDAEAAYDLWRAGAADVMLLLIGFAALPQILLWLLGFDLPATGQVVAVVALVLLVAAAATVRRWPVDVRIWLIMGLTFIASVQGLLWYTGAIARVWLAGIPVLALVLGGPRTALVAASISIAIVVLHATAAAAGLADGWSVQSFDETRTRVIVARAAMWMAFFIPLMFLLRGFYRFQIRTLAAERELSARLAQEIAERTAAHAALADAVSERDRLEQDIAHVSDVEQRRLGHDLHDGVGQQLAGALLRSAVLEEHLSVEDPARAEEAHALCALLESAMGEVQEVARSLAPIDMHPTSLGHALRTLAQRAGGAYGVRSEYRESGEVNYLGREKTLHLYRIAQEAVNNAGKHARAGRIDVALASQDGHVVLTVEDDGSGLPCPAPAHGMGLSIMTYRAERMGGRLEFQRTEGGGTRVLCRVPRGDDGG
ncbi:MAG TPA: sensor histidine kinase [Longimicrobiales bacterium]|nr:sensor histidine kinase [Longimicrobiales bacterium]